MRTIVTTLAGGMAALALAAGLPGLTAVANAAPACTDPVANTLHRVHDATGDPAGVGHEVEETYCGVRP